MGHRSRPRPGLRPVSTGSPFVAVSPWMRCALRGPNGFVGPLGPCTHPVPVFCHRERRACAGPVSPRISPGRALAACITVGAHSPPRCMAAKIRSRGLWLLAATLCCCYYMLPLLLLLLHALPLLLLLLLLLLHAATAAVLLLASCFGPFTPAACGPFTPAAVAPSHLKAHSWFFGYGGCLLLRALLAHSRPERLFLHPL